MKTITDFYRVVVIGPPIGQETELLLAFKRGNLSKGYIPKVVENYDMCR
jgi:hypothetical protein